MINEEIERLNKLLEEEYNRWEKAKLTTNLIPHTSESIWHLKMEVQAMMNLLLTKGLITADELNVQFKTIQLNDMQTMREGTQEARREAIVAKPKLGIPKLHVVGGKDGIEL